MKTCQTCGMTAEDDAATCAACGQASWCHAAPKAEPQHDQPAGDPGTEPMMPRHQRRRR